MATRATTIRRAKYNRVMRRLQYRGWNRTDCVRCLVCTREKEQCVESTAKQLRNCETGFCSFAVGSPFRSWALCFAVGAPVSQFRSWGLRFATGIRFRSFAISNSETGAFNCETAKLRNPVSQWLRSCFAVSQLFRSGSIRNNRFCSTET